jgi:thiol-disulfide isomerase/thioredoxin
MDRLHAVGALALGAAVALAAGCDRDRDNAPPETARRFEAVGAKPDKPVSLDEFCDVRGEGAGAKRFVPPALAAGAIPSGGGWKWINLWATWCKPCIEEMPMLARWKTELEKDGLSYQPVFVSVDIDDATVASYRQAHPMPESLRLAQPDALPSWLTQIGLDANATIPIHLFVDGEGRVRCARAGSLREKDLDAVRQILAGK